MMRAAPLVGLSLLLVACGSPDPFADIAAEEVESPYVYVEPEEDVSTVGQLADDREVDGLLSDLMGGAAESKLASQLLELGVTEISPCPGAIEGVLLVSPDAAEPRLTSGGTEYDPQVREFLRDGRKWLAHFFDVSSDAPETVVASVPENSSGPFAYSARCDLAEDPFSISLDGTEVVISGATDQIITGEVVFSYVEEASSAPEEQGEESFLSIPLSGRSPLRVDLGVTESYIRSLTVTFYEPYLLGYAIY